MKKNKGYLAAVHSSIEASIIQLAADRERIELELRALTAALGILESPAPKKNGNGHGNGARKDFRAMIVAHLAKNNEVTPTSVAKHIGCSPTYACTILGKVAKRVRTGVYTRKGA